MLNEGKSYVAKGQYYGINEFSVRSIKKEENNIRTMAAISFNKDAKRVATVRNKTMVRMESALTLWINDCRKKTLRWIRTLSAQKLEHCIKLLMTAAVRGKRRRMPMPVHHQVLFTQYQAHLMLARAGLKSLRNALDLKMFLCTERWPLWIPLKQNCSCTIIFKTIIEEGRCKPEQVFNMDETGLFWKRMPSRTFIMQEEAKAPGFKTQKIV